MLKTVMPSLSWIVAPGVLHHVIVRCIERKSIFCDNADHLYTDRRGEVIARREGYSILD